MGITWTWLEGGEGKPPAGVEIAGKQYAWRATTEEEFLGFHEGLLDAMEVYQGIRCAREAIETGAAQSYDGAAARLLGIVREHRKAEQFLHQAALRLSVFFEPAGLMESFGADAIAMRRFIEEASERVRAREVKP